MILEENKNKNQTENGYVNVGKSIVIEDIALVIK
jgi:hypothetical protein